MTFAYVAPLAAAALFAGVLTASDAASPKPAASTTIAAATLRGARDLGPAADKRVDFSIVLPYRHPGDLPYLLAAQRNPASKYYRHYLKATEFLNYFAPTPTAYLAAAANLQHAGFVVETFSNRTVLHAYGSASSANRYFHTAIDAVRSPSGQLAYANVTPAVVPPGLDGAHIVGLSSIVNAHTAATPHAFAARPAASGGPLFGPDGGFGPLAIAKTEDFPVEHGYTGKNANVADLIDGSVSDKDVATFLGTFGVQRSGPRTTTVHVDGGCGTFCFDSFGATLDAEWILAMAPGASIFVYQMPFLSNNGIVDAFNSVASDDSVNVVNFSVGACEVNGGDLELAIEPIIAQIAALGISVESVAFGGANLCNVPPLVLPMAPANLDTVTAVGGSSAFVDISGKLIAQSPLSSSNGGISIVVPLPSWQASTYGITPGGRNVPDIVFPGSVDGTGPSVYFSGAWVGGFPFVNNAPFAGYLATVQEMYGYTTPLGNIAPAIYAAYNKSGYNLFNDITLGCIGAVGGVPVCARSGYDISSGLGSIGGGYALAKSLNYGPMPSPTP